MKVLFQLHIDKEIVRDWSGDIYHSRLYHSAEACMKGCLGDELFEIAVVLWRNGDFPAESEDMAEIDCDNARILKERHENGDAVVVAYVQKVGLWLLSSSNKSFYGDDSMSWRMLGFEVVDK